MRIVIDEKIPYIRGLFESHADVTYLPADKFSQATIKDATVLIIRSRTICNESILNGSSVRFIATCTIGHDHIDTEWCDANGIGWTNAPGCNSSSVMQYVISSILHLTLLKGRSPVGMTLGIVGAGHIGKKVAAKADALGLKVLINDPPRERIEGKSGFVTLDHLLENSDIVTMHVPITYQGEDKTYHLADESFFRRMKSGSFFINSSRGEVTENEAIKKYIKSGKLSGTALDVWEFEPFVDKELLSLTDVSTPHIAGYSIEGRANASYEAAKKVAEFIGISLNDWEPAGLPAPQDSIIDLGPALGDHLTSIYLAVTHSCPLEEDTLHLKYNPGSFEEMRGIYRVRREFPYYTVTSSGEAALTLKKLGFNVS